MNVAISDKEGTLSLYGLSENRGNVSVGASVIKNHNSLFYDASESKALKVPAIRVSKLIEESSKKYATIVVKMDIESAEYDALEDLINTGCMEKISHIYIEWHAQYYSDDQIEDILVRENKIKENLSGKFTDWC
jgi:FkbM family methyltransferase